MKNLSCIVLATVAVAGLVSRTAALEPGDTVGPVKLMSLSDETLTMDNYGERPGTTVIFMSSRCDTTARAVADINQLYRKYRLRNVLYVGVCSDTEDSPDEIRTFAQRSGFIFPVYRDVDGDVAKQFGATKTPELFLLDQEGKLVFHGGWQDEAARQAYEDALASLVRKEPVVATHAVVGTLIDKPGPKRETPDPYGAIAFSSELVFEQIPFAPAHHCSTICETAGGDLLCLWYGGSYESADDQALFLARKKPGEKSWSEPEVLLQGATAPPGNGVIFRDATNRLWIVWCQMEGSRPTRRGSGWNHCRLFSRTSTDHGLTWSEDLPVLEEELWCVPRNPPIALADGTLLLPVEGLQDKVEGSHFLTLARDESAWRRAGFTSGGSQPAVIQRRDGTLLALLRHSRNITQIDSRDGGQTWSNALATELKNPDSGITMTRLANGHLLVVYNDSPTRRTPLVVARSIDEGKTWEEPRQLESNPGEYSYPCIIQTADGRIHVSYTYRRYSIKHVEFNEDWLVHIERPD
jgi:predicted neuraminidase/peroxiredoxin